MDKTKRLSFETAWPSEALSKAIQLLEPLHSFETLSIIDVGAHRGETLRTISELVPSDLRYFAFEPNPESFSELLQEAQAVREGISISCLPFAVGAHPETVKFRVARASEVSGILHPETELLRRVSSGDHELQEEIDVKQVSIDMHIADQGLKRVEILKIDTEGYDLEVIKGARTALERGAVEVLIVEVFFVKYRENQSFFWDIACELNQLNYSFVNLYDTRDTGQGRLYTGNGIWVSPGRAKLLSYL